MRVFDRGPVKRVLAHPRTIDVFVTFVRVKDRAELLARRVYRRCQRPGS